MALLLPCWWGDVNDQEANNLSGEVWQGCWFEHDVPWVCCREAVSKDICMAVEATLFTDSSAVRELCRISIR